MRFDPANHRRLWAGIYDEGVIRIWRMERIVRIIRREESLIAQRAGIFLGRPRSAPARQSVPGSFSQWIRARGEWNRHP
jgi:hypothetical protein